LGRRDNHDWEQRKLMSTIRSITDFRGRTPKKLGLDWSDNGYLALSALNVKNGYIDFSQDAHYGNQELYDRWMGGKELYKNQVLFTTEAPMGNVAQVPDNNGYILSQRTIAFEVNEEYITDDFLATVLRSPVVFSALTALSSGGTAKGVSQRTLNSLDFSIPKDTIEQTKIANYFNALNHLITLHQRKLFEAKNNPKNGSKNFFRKIYQKLYKFDFNFKTYDWEQRKLGEVGTAKSGVGFPDAEQGGIEGIPFFKVSDMNIEGNENELVVANNYVTAEQINRKKWNVINDVPAIFFAKVGAAVMLNRKRLVRFPFLLDNNTMAYVFNKNVWNCDFGKTLFETLDLTKLTQVGALPSYNASDVENVRINIPNKNEQQKIGEYFSNLDHLITLHQREVFYTLKHIFYRCCDTLLSGGLY
jgi:type I restriction enzyme S subunit